MKKSIRIIAFIMAALLCLPMLFACGSKKEEEKTDDTTKAEQKDDAEKTEIVMATNAQFPPYEFIADDGSYSGIDVEIMQAVAEKLGMTLKVEDMDFDAIIPAVQSGKADVGAAGLTVTEDRKESVDFSVTYTTACQVIIVKNDSAIKGPDDLHDVTVGVQTGTTGDIYISGEEDSNITVERYKTGFEAVQSLVDGKIDAVVIDNEPAKVFVAENSGIKILDTEYALEEYALCTSKDSKDLLDDINGALEALIADGTIDSIIAKYINTNDAADTTAADTTVAETTAA